MRPRVLLFLITAAWLLSPAEARADTKLRATINGSYIMYAEYTEKLAYAGNRNLLLKVWLASEGNVPESARLAIDNVQSRDDQRIKVTRLDCTAGGRSCDFRLDIPTGVEPKFYELTAELLDQRQTRIPARISVNVGVRSQGKLRLVESKTDPLVLGAARPYALRFANDFADYTVNINRIAVNSLPSDLVESVEVEPGTEFGARVENNVIIFDPAVSVEPAQQVSIPVRLKLRSVPSFINWITGYGDDTRLAFDVRYNDGHERAVSDFTPEAAVKVRPGDGFLFWTMLFGVLVGTVIKYRLERLRKKGMLSGKEIAGFVAVTVMVGIVITIVAWAGELQIVAFKTDALSYDKPSVIFIIGLMGALSGVHYLHNWTKKLTNGGEAK